MIETENQAVEKKTRKFWLIPVGILGGIVALAVIAAVVFFVINRFSVEIQMNGDGEMVMQYGEAYGDPGATAHLMGTLFFPNGREVAASVSGEVDTTTLGDYTVTYSAGVLWYKKSVERVIHVVDTIPPVIELVSDPEGFTIPGETYVEEGYTATDNYDGDLTAQVTREEKDGMVTYRVTDSCGNETVVRREIYYFDPIAPELTLKGSDSITITAGTKFSEPGYVATDNCDGDITDRVVVSGNLDIYRAGTYEVIYTVEDSYQNKATATRTVTVKPVKQPASVSPTGKVIYLTFDDGPSGHTGRLLDVLARHNVKATFFVTNKGNYDLFRRMVNEGHAIAVHTATHQYKTVYASEEAYFNDLNTMKGIIQRETGVDTTLVRFPGGSSNTVSSFNRGIMTRLTKAVTDMGYQYFDWNVDSRDAGGATTADQVFQNVVNGIGNKNYAVVLQHDIKGYSVDAVDRIIAWGLANGYSFQALTPSSPTCHHRENN